jgi:hypothetical protein
MVFTTYSKTLPTRNGWKLISTINQHAKKLKHVHYMNDEGFMYPELCESGAWQTEINPPGFHQ